MAPWIDTALRWFLGVLFAALGLGICLLIWADGRPRFPGWAKPRSRQQAAVDKAIGEAFDKVDRSLSRLGAGGCAGHVVAEQAKTDDGPLTVDTVLLSPGEVAVFDASGALVVWFPAPGSEAGSVVCQKAVTILTYDDMPQASPRMREQLRLLKGGRSG